MALVGPVGGSCACETAHTCPIRRERARQLLGSLVRPILSPPRAPLFRNWSRCLAESSARLPSAHGGSMRRQELSWWLLGQRAGNQPAEPAGMAREPPPEVAKCSVMMGGQLMSRRQMFGCSGPKSGSAGSSWRPQLTQISAAPQTMTPVLQDKPHHSTDLAELCSLILWSALFPFRS